jgi:hypothetical protein
MCWSPAAKRRTALGSGADDFAELEIATELAHTEPDYVDMAHRFCQHFLWIASATAHAGDDTGMWDEEDGFF